MQRTSPAEPPAPPQVPLVAAPAVAPEAVVHRVEVGSPVAAWSQEVKSWSQVLLQLVTSGHKFTTGHNG